ncbi:uncharacterized protein CTRU02_205787 [Colletotrichum truncatum]|uniref:Uncharacterized protein n=1 Tax=Colletotrichum truncatum TaxID=5467 RepID=A0ACC3Z541_COLTU
MRALHQVIILASLAQVAFGKCYTPNGVDRNSEFLNSDKNSYAPCSGPSHSMCFRLTNDTDLDVCRGYGLCWNTAERKLWRESCTDPTWQHPNCLKLCRSVDTLGRQFLMSENDVEITQCADMSYCCGADAEAAACCREGRGARIVGGQVVNDSAASASASLSRSTSLLPDPTVVAPTATNEANASPKIIGGIAGGALGGVIIALGLVG